MSAIRIEESEATPVRLFASRPSCDCCGLCFTTARTRPAAPHPRGSSRDGAETELSGASAEGARDAARSAIPRVQRRVSCRRSRLAASVPVYNRSIIPVMQPDGSTLFRPQEQNTSNADDDALAAAAVHRRRALREFVAAARAGSRERDTRNWTSTPFLVGIRQQLFRPNTAAGTRASRTWSRTSPTASISRRARTSPPRRPTRSSTTTARRWRSGTRSQTPRSTTRCTR